MDISSYFFANWVLVTNKTAQSWNECSCQLSILTEKWEVIAKRRITPYSRINLDQVGINGRKRYEFVSHSFGSDLKLEKSSFPTSWVLHFHEIRCKRFPLWWMSECSWIILFELSRKSGVTRQPLFNSFMPTAFHSLNKGCLVTPDFRLRSNRIIHSHLWHSSCGNKRFATNFILNAHSIGGK